MIYFLHCFNVSELALQCDIFHLVYVCFLTVAECVKVEFYVFENGVQVGKSVRRHTGKGRTTQIILYP